MRVIKFRAWDKELKQMFYFADWHFNSEYCLLAFDIQDHPEYSFGDLPCEEQNVFLMQFTGLKDRYGKEIYEGDIVKYFLPTLKEWKIAKVAWSDLWAAFWVVNDDWSDADWVKLQDIEIIGNIYENPDLKESTP